jgi:hypothetical protein
LEIKSISPSGVFCLGVYYTRDNTYKDCYIRQGGSQLGAFRTSTSKTGGRTHRVHRVATAAFWHTFSHEGKISPG